MTENPIAAQLKTYRVLLASGSPRRQEFLRAMGVSFERVKNHVEEKYPIQLQGAEISDFLARLKADALRNSLQPRDILLTADTVVWHRGKSLAKPATVSEAMQMLEILSGQWHEVITSVCFTTTREQQLVNCTTAVQFAKLTEGEIRYYAETFKPFDKAGAYGIQEWLGMVAIEEIRGSYPNVVGMPTHLVYKTLMAMAT